MTYRADDNDKTVVSSGVRQRQVAAQSGVSDSEHQSLPPGTRIAEFEIIGLIGIGGFGIVYLARDYSLGRDVALKEYMPSSLAFRSDGTTVTPRSENCADTFSLGLRSFINEAHMLALFDHPSLVKVYRFWEANGTAYMVMPHYEGCTLKQTLSKMTERPSEQWLKNLLGPLLDALQLIHQKNCFHRDIAPDNIFLLTDGQPVLLDFGAARLVIGDMAKNLTVILKPGYAPVEQYAGDPNMPQGAWTDIYALGAVVHYAMTGAPPITSVSRLINDTQVPLNQSCKGKYSEGFLQAVDQALSVKAAQRPQNISALRDLLSLNDRPSALVGTATQAGHVLPQVPAPVKSSKTLQWVLGSLVVVGLCTIGFFLTNGAHQTAPPTMAAKPLLPEKIPDVASVLPDLPAMSGPVEPIVLLDRILEHRDSGHKVTAGLDKPRLVIGKDTFRFRVTSDKGGYVYILMLGTNKGLNLLFPNAPDKNNKVKANQELALPGRNWAMPVDGPAGTDQFVVLVSELPRDFTKAGLVKAGSFGEFPLGVLQDNQQSMPASPNILAGEPVCPVASDCSGAYGAVRFSVDEVN